MTTGQPTLIDSPEAADTGLRCPECEYNLTGLTQDLCPECGQPFDREELLAAVTAPIPMWSRRRQIGIFKAFFGTILTIWFRPIHFAKRFPTDADQRDAFVFSNWCMVVALAMASGMFAYKDELLSEPFTCLMTSIGIVVGIIICEVAMAVTVFSGNDFEFTDAFALARMTRAYHILSVPLAVNYIVEHSSFGVPRGFDAILVTGLYVFAAYWWFCITCVAVTYRKHLANLILSILLLPLCVFASLMLSTITVTFTTMMVFILTQ